MPAPGFQVNAFATGLDHPRWLYVQPSGDVLVAETNAPVSEPKGLEARIMKQVKQRTGAAVPSADRIRLLRDADGDGIAEWGTVFAEGLHSPFGTALVDNDFYVANTDVKEGGFRPAQADFALELGCGRAGTLPRPS